jgi:predicted O-methyltransferase YrrM
VKGGNIKKISRLIGYFATHPLMLKTYIRKSINNSATPISLELPWISFAAIQFLEKFLQPSLNVAEFGGGGSTLFFAKRTASVLCVESHKDWVEKIETALALNNISNVRIEGHTFDPKDQEAYASSSYLQSIEGQSYDVILVDGYEEYVELRPTCFYRAEKCVKKGGIIIVDDSWRYLSLRKNNNAQNWKEFRSIGPCRPGVTTTDIFFY